MMQQEDACPPAPEQRGETASHRSVESHAEPKGKSESGDHPKHEGTVHEADHPIGQEVLGIAVLIGHLHVAEDPTDVGVQEPAYRSPPSGSVAHVGTVRITVDVGE